MRRVICSLIVVLMGFALSLDAQRPHQKPGDQDESDTLPNGKLQQDAILKADHEKNITDARDLARLAAELRDDVEKGDPFVLSVATLKKLDDIDKLAKRIRGRIKRY